MSASAPAGLGSKAKALWSGIAGAYELRVDELRVLEDVCREVDLIERLEAEMREAPLTVKGSMGQLVAHPITQELRQHRTVVKQLLGSLKLPDSEDGAAEGRSVSARHAAIARWGRGA